MSRLVHNSSAALAKQVGGAAAMESLCLEVEAIELPACPFCGGEADVILTETYMMPHVMVRCRECRCGTTGEATGHDLIHERTITIYDALARAIARWSRRKESAA